MIAGALRPPVSTQEVLVQRSKRGRRVESTTPEIDLEPVVQRTLVFLESCPHGASRVDILTAMNLQNSAWPTLRRLLERTGHVMVIGRGPGLRHIHTKFMDSVPKHLTEVAATNRSERLNEARARLREILQDETVIDSSVAQKATGLNADPVRRLLLELVDEGVVERTGQKRSTRYRWVG